MGNQNMINSNEMKLHIAMYKWLIPGTINLKATDEHFKQ